MNNDKAYLVIEAQERFEVRSELGTCIIICSNKPNAEHYSLLLNQAFDAGYKQARRDLNNDSK